MTASILVVDDEPDVVDLFKRRFRRELRRGDYVMHFADSGEAALQQLTAGVRPEMMLILSDINMPGMNGLELLKEVKTLWPELPVGFQTALFHPVAIARHADDPVAVMTGQVGAHQIGTDPRAFLGRAALRQEDFADQPAERLRIDEHRHHLPAILLACAARN